MAPRVGATPPHLVVSGRTIVRSQQSLGLSGVAMREDRVEMGSMQKRIPPLPYGYMGSDSVWSAVWGSSSTACCGQTLVGVCKTRVGRPQGSTDIWLVYTHPCPIIVGPTAHLEL